MKETHSTRSAQSTESHSTYGTASEQIRRKQAPQWYFNGMMLVAFIALFSFTLLYVKHEVNASKRADCELYVALDERYSALPQADPEQLKLFTIIRNLRKNKGCSKPTRPLPPVSTLQPTRTPNPTPTTND